MKPTTKRKKSIVTKIVNKEMTKSEAAITYGVSIYSIRNWYLRYSRGIIEKKEK